MIPAVDERSRDGTEQQVRERGREEHETLASAEPVEMCTTATSATWLSGRRRADELTGPQRRERAVERETDVWVLADALEGGGRGGRGGARVAAAAVAVAAVAAVSKRR